MGGKEKIGGWRFEGNNGKGNGREVGDLRMEMNKKEEFYVRKWKWKIRIEEEEENDVVEARGEEKGGN